MLGLLFSALLGSSALMAASPADVPVEAAESPEQGNLPQLVRARDAFLVRTPVALSLVGYRPLVDVELGWAHAIEGPHWITFAGAARLDYASTERITGVDCEGECPKFGVYGGELSVGYRFTPRFHRKPWLVPEAHGAVLGGAWTYGDREALSHSTVINLGLRVGGGLRVFVKPRVGVGMDVDLLTDLQLRRATSGIEPAFGLGLALFPLMFEIRG